LFFSTCAYGETPGAADNIPEIHLMELSHRPRRNRRSAAIRTLVRETVLTPGDLIWPVFVMEGTGERVPVACRA
jgi:porphobilinogen synthase